MRSLSGTYFGEINFDGMLFVEVMLFENILIQIGNRISN